VEFQLIELVIKSIDKMDEAIWKCMTCGEKFLEFEAVGKHRKSQHYGNQYKNKRRRAESQKESSEETKEEMNVDATETIYDSDSEWLLSTKSNRRSCGCAQPVPSNTTNTSICFHK